MRRARIDHLTTHTHTNSSHENEASDTKEKNETHENAVRLISIHVEHVELIVRVYEVFVDRKGAVRDSNCDGERY